MCKDYQLKKEFLETLFKELLGNNSLETKNILLHNYSVAVFSTEKGDIADQRFFIAIREHDSAIVLFDEDMMGSDESDSINIFDNPPYFEIVPDYEKEKSYYYLYSNNKKYKFAVGEQLCVATQYLINKFIKKYREHFQK